MNNKYNKEIENEIATMGDVAVHYYARAIYVTNLQGKVLMVVSTNACNRYLEVQYTLDHA